MNYYHMVKHAGLIGDTIGGSLWGGTGPATVGALTAATSPTHTREDLEDIDDTAALSLIPGVASNRMYKRDGRSRRLAKARSGGTGKWWSEQLGGTTSSMLAAGTGAAIGAAVAPTLDGGYSRGEGAFVGAGAGLAATVLAHLIGGATALSTKTRTAEEQEDDDKGGWSLADYAVPGHAGHDRLKRRGHDAWGPGAEQSWKQRGLT